MPRDHLFSVDRKIFYPYYLLLTFWVLYLYHQTVMHDCWYEDSIMFYKNHAIHFYLSIRSHLFRKISIASYWVIPVRYILTEFHSMWHKELQTFLPHRPFVHIHCRCDCSHHDWW